ncbi:S-layer homology domain-containing protein [Paenibacillus sp. An7]|uniref:S-layer homology domain-containing protein n=1 Tax=Paenibacillus sp. An7 TaxID=2689577 RepID=UPI00135BE6B4|nr:S-layer homology domain-containing protein [Paenibacillus sp. An7]
MKYTVRRTFTLLLVCMLMITGSGWHALTAFASISDNGIPKQHLRIHYEGDGEGLGVWTWEDVVAPSQTWATDAIPFSNEQQDTYGAYVDIQLKEDAQKVGFLIVNRETGQKDGGDKMVNLDNLSVNEVWVKKGSDKVYPSEPEFTTELLSAKVISENEIQLRFSDTKGLTDEQLFSEIIAKDRDGEGVQVNKAEIASDRMVSLAVEVTMKKLPITITYAGVTVTSITDYKMIDAAYSYDGDDLGASYTPEKVTFKIWSPTASSVTLNVYDKDDSTIQVGSKPLVLVEKGIWEAEVQPSEMNLVDLRGYFYQYDVVNNGVSRKVLDPYAKSMAVFQVDTNGNAGPDGDTVGKAAIVSLEGTDPQGYDYAAIDGYKKREDAIIYELHVRDFTSDPSIESELGDTRWGSYAAVKQKLSYIKSLGVTHVQLLPIMAWYYGDETKMGERELTYSASGNEYNWGYDPHHYFSPDGAYSEDPADPELRIRETKEMIDAIHEAGMGVVLDVVYTHMAKADLLNDIVPNYYAWQDETGSFVGGFGNNLATNHAMAEKLMIDSVKYWFDEYKIDGMRFDMMGDATYSSIQKAYDAAAALNPNALFIGEGWRTFSGALADPSLAGQGADQDWMNQTDDVGVFSDEIRNELKSGFGSEGEPRFLTGGARNIDLILNNIKGQPSNTPADAPGDMVQYIEAHDNLPLYDVIAQSIKKDPAIPENDVEIHQRIRLGNLMILTSQGTAFLHAGQEYGRTKQWFGEGVPEQKYHALEDEEGNVFGYFIHDSYDSSDAINKFDWSKAMNRNRYPVNNTTRAYTEGLIQLRKSTNAFRLGEKELVDRNISLIAAPEIRENDLIIAYKNQSTDQTGDYYVFVNADRSERTLTLPVDLTKGTVIVDQDEAGISQVQNPSGYVLEKDSITLEPLTAVVIKMNSSAENPAVPGPSEPSIPSEPSVPSKPTPAIPVAPSESGQAEKWEQELTALLTSIPAEPKTAAKEIMSIVTPLLTVDKFSITLDQIGSTIVAPDSTALSLAYKRLQRAWDQISLLNKTQHKDLLLILQQELKVVLDTKSVQGEKIAVELPTSFVEQVHQLSSGVQVISNSGSVTIPAGAIEANYFIPNGSFVITLSKASDFSTTHDASMKAVGDGLTLSMKLIQNGNGGATSEIYHFVKPVLLEGLYQPEQVSNLNKTGWYIKSSDQKHKYVSDVNEEQVNLLKTKRTGTYYLLESTLTFSDINQSYAKGDIEYLRARQIVNGITDSTFAPKMKVTRGQLAVILGRMLGLSEETAEKRKFVDVEPQKFYSGYINALSSAGIVNGDPSHTFRPEQNITREEMITALMNAYEYKTGQKLSGIPGYEEAEFRDISEVSAYATSAAKAAKALGIIEGSGGQFQPKEIATREQLAKIAVQFLKSTKE